jgi:hypothetical protein
MIDARFLGALAACLGLGTLAAAMLGLLNAVPLQLVHGITGLALAALLFLAPGLFHGRLRRLPGREEPRDSLAALGAAAALAFTGLGAFALAATAVNAAYADVVWKLFFPFLPVAGALGGLGREGWRATLRWLDAESRDEP